MAYAKGIQHAVSHLYKLYCINIYFIYQRLGVMVFKAAEFNAILHFGVLTRPSMNNSIILDHAVFSKRIVGSKTV